MRNHRRLWILVTCVLLLAALLSSYAFLGVFAAHHCEDHRHCDICEHAALLTRMLRCMLVLLIPAAAAGVRIAVRPAAVRRTVGHLTGLTPVILKTRLNN